MPLNDLDIISPSPEAVVCVSSASSALSASQRAVLDFILSHTKWDKRPYFSVEILGVKLVCWIVELPKVLSAELVGSFFRDAV